MFRKYLYFLFASLQLSSQKFIIRQKKYWRSIYRPPSLSCTPQLTPKDEEINQMIFHYNESLSVILYQHYFIVLCYFISPHSFFAGSHVHIHRPLVSENNFLLSLFPGQRLKSILSFVLNCIFQQAAALIKVLFCSGFDGD